MIAGLKLYEAYADTGHDWMGALPAHWGQLRAKRLFREVDERSTTGKEEPLSVSHLSGVTPRRTKTVTMFVAESNVRHKVCRPGDLVVNTLWAWMAAQGGDEAHRPREPAILFQETADDPGGRERTPRAPLFSSPPPMPFGPAPASLQFSNSNR